MDRVADAADRVERKIVNSGRATRQSGRTQVATFDALFKAVEPISGAVDRMADEIKQLRTEFAALSRTLTQTLDQMRRLQSQTDLSGLNRQVAQTGQSLRSVANDAGTATTALSGVGATAAAQSAVAAKAAVSAGASMASSTLPVVAGMAAIGAAAASSGKQTQQALGGGMSDAVLEMIADSNRAALEITGIYAAMAENVQKKLDAIKAPALPGPQGPGMDVSHDRPGRASPKTFMESNLGSELPKQQIEGWQALAAEQASAAEQSQSAWARAWARIRQAGQTVTTNVGDFFRGLKAGAIEELHNIVTEMDRMEADAQKAGQAVAAVGDGPVRFPNQPLEQEAQKSAGRIRKWFSNTWTSISTGAKELPGALRNAFGPISGLLGSIGVGLSFASFSATVDEAQDALNRVQSTLKSTGNVVGLTTDEIFAMAGKIQQASRLSAQEILRAQSVLLTFNQIGGDSFERVTQAAVDMAARFGTDLRSSSVQLGKALQDPIAGVASLREVGVTMTKQQEEQIKAFVKTGEVAKAHNVILSELENQVKGAALASRNTLGGAMAALRNNISDTTVAFAEGNGSASLLTATFEGLSSWVVSLQDNIPGLSGAIAGLGAAIGTVAVAATLAWIAALGPLGVILMATTALITGLGYVIGTAVGELDVWIKAQDDMAGKSYSAWQKSLAVISVWAASVRNHMRAVVDYVVEAMSALATNVYRSVVAIGTSTAQLMMLDFSGAAKTMSEAAKTGLIDVADSAKKAYDDRIASFDWGEKMREKLGTMEAGVAVATPSQFPTIPTGNRPPPPTAPADTGGAAAADALRNTTAEAAAAERLAKTYQQVLDAKVRLNAVHLQRLTNPADATALDNQIAQLQRAAEATERLQAEIDVETKLRAIKAKAGSAEYGVQERLIRQQAAATLQQKQLQKEIEAAGQTGQLQRQEAAAKQAVAAYEIVAAVATTAAQAGYGQSDAIAQATQQAEHQVQAFERIGTILDLNIGRESQFYNEAVRTVEATQAQQRAREQLNRVIDAGQAIADHKQDAIDIRAIADAYRVSTAAGEAMERQVANENFVRSLNLHLLGEQGIKLEELARKAAEERDAADLYRQKIEATRGAWQEYTETLTSASDMSRSISDASGSALQGIEDQFVSLATTGKASFADLAQSVMADLTRILVRALILRPIMAALGLGAAPIPAASGGITQMASGGVSGGTGGRLISTPTLLPSRSGPILAGEAGASEAILPLKRTPMGKLGVQASGGGGGGDVNYNLQMTVNPAPNESPEQTAKTMARMQRSLDGYFNQKIANEKRSRGLLAGAGISG